MTLVIDASVVAAWLMPDERAFDLAGVAQRYDAVIAPRLFWVEIRNVLLMAERRGRLVAGRADELLEALGSLDINFDDEPSAVSVMTLSRRHRLTAYDALYLDLAVRRMTDLATFDRALRAAAEVEGVTLA